MKSLLTVALLGLAHPLAAHPAEKTIFDKVVYVNDDRMDVCETSNPVFEDIALNSVAAIVDIGVLGNSVGGKFDLSSHRPLGSRRGLCADQRFRSHPTAAVCSATLIGPDRMLTAGHCISDSTCARRRFVFNYLYSGPDCTMPEIIEERDVFSCTRVVRVENDNVDFAVVWLDRSATDKTVVPTMALNNPVQRQAQLTVIGFGSGIPAKIDSGGFVIDPRAHSMDYFVASTDTFAGNSGSGVFDNNGVLIGILVRGQTDYIRMGSCYRVNVVGCSDEKCSKLNDAEEITYAYIAINAVPNCNTAQDCPSGGRCDRRCPAQSDACTGWCA